MASDNAAALATQQSIKAYVDANTGGVTISNNSNNRVLTGDGSNANGEANLTFDGSALTLAGSLDATGDSFTFRSSTENAPIVEIKTTHTTINAEGELRFTKDAANSEDQESLGMITFYGDDDAGNQHKFAHIRAKANDVSNAAEGGRLFLAIASHDAEMQNGLELVDGNAEDEIDVNIASGTSSMTTIAGHLKVANGNYYVGNDTLEDYIVATMSSGTRNISGVAAQATILQNARTIGGVSFDGSANIDLPGVNAVGNQNTSGSAATLTTTRAFQTNLGSTSTANFDGSATCSPGVTGTLAVGNGGTGVTTMTNLKNALDDETWTFANKITSDAGIDIDNFNIDGTTIALSSGDMTLDPAGDMVISMEDGSNIDFKNGGNVAGRFYAESGTASTFTIMENGGDSTSDYCSINVATHGATTISTVDAAAAAAHFEIAADGNITLDAAGNVAIEATTTSVDGILDLTGTTDASDATGDTGILRCEGGASIAKKLYAGSTITSSADVIAYSDERLKENIKTLDGKKVLEMRGVSFDRVDTKKASSGVIAQEMEKVAPELVIDDGNYKGVAYGNLVGYLIEAIKDQQKQIDELKERCNGCSK